MAKYVVKHFRDQCISCGACAALSPTFWKMDDEGMAELVGSVKVKDHFELVIESESDKAENQEAADCCPVNIIHVEKKSD